MYQFLLYAILAFSLCKNLFAQSDFGALIGEPIFGNANETLMQACKKGFEITQVDEESFDFSNLPKKHIGTTSLKTDKSSAASKIVSVRPVIDAPFVLSTSKRFIDSMDTSKESDDLSLMGEDGILKKVPYEIRLYAPKSMRKSNEPLFRVLTTPDKGGTIYWKKVF